MSECLDGPRAAIPLRPVCLRQLTAADGHPAFAGLPAVAGVVPFSSVDWPGQLAAVIFIGGCPWRCHYCHNPHLQQRTVNYDWDETCHWLANRSGLLDGVVFSGGEPLSEARLPQMISTVRALGFKVALHSAGIYPQRLAAVLPLVEWVGLDIKCNAAGYDALTGRARSSTPVEHSLQLLLESGLPFECRTTWSPAWLSEDALLDLAHRLSLRGVRAYAVQNFRPEPGAAPTAALGQDALRRLSSWFERFEYR